MSLIAERSVVVRLRVEVAEYQRGIAEAEAATKRLSASMRAGAKDSTEALNRLSNGLGLVGGAMTAFGALAVKKFADFDAAMDSVQASTMESAENMAALRDAAIDAGKQTVYSASESASAIESLAKAGVSTKDILGGGLTGALDLAASGAIDVADAADIAATGLAQFGLDGSKTSHVADLLAAGAGKAQGGVEDLGMALKQGGLVAHQTGLSIEETTGTLAAFAKQGLIGSDAGTSLKTMLQRLTPQSDEARKKMDELGISAYDSSGQFVGMAKFAGNLQSALKGLTPEARNAALAVIFGSDAVRGASVLYDQGEKGIRDWISAVDDSGYAAKQAGIRLDNLKGDWEQLSGSVETALIGMGEGSDSLLREIVQNATDVVNAFSELPQGAQDATLAIVGGGGLVTLGLAGLGKLIVAVNSVRSALSDMKISLKTAGTAAGGLGAVAVIGTLALAKFASMQQEAKQRADDLKASLDQATGAITTNTRATVYAALEADGIIKLANQYGINLDLVTDAALGNATALKSLGDEYDRLKGKSTGSPTSPEDMQAMSDAAGAAAAYERVLGEVGHQEGEVAAQQAAWRDEQEAGLHTTDQATAAAEDNRSAIEKLADGTDDVTDSTSSFVDALKDLVDAQKGIADTALSERDAQRQFQDAVDEATKSVKENGKTLDITTEKGRANQDALDQIAQSGWDVVDSMRANGASQADLQQSMAGTRQSFIDAATQMGLSEDAASALADQLNLIPDNVSVAVAIDTATAQAAIDRFIGLNGSRSIVLDLGATVVRPGQVMARADGGPISGPGTGTSDSIPALLSNGEYVVSAAAVQQYGQGLFDLLNARQFAAGGLASLYGLATPEGLTAPGPLRGTAKFLRRAGARS